MEGWVFDLLWVEFSEIYFGRETGSISAVEAGDSG
jgi:hypothetical protein